MIRWNVSKSNEAIDREQAIAKLRKLTRYCKWGTICTIVALALALLAVIAIEDLVILPSLSQGFCLQSVELEASEGPFSLSSAPMNRLLLCLSRTTVILP